MKDYLLMVFAVVLSIVSVVYGIAKEVAIWNFIT